MNGYQNFEPANDEDLEDEQSSGEGEDNGKRWFHSII